MTCPCLAPSHTSAQAFCRLHRRQGFCFTGGGFSLRLCLSPVSFELGAVVDLNSFCLTPLFQSVRFCCLFISPSVQFLPPSKHVFLPLYFLTFWGWGRCLAAREMCFHLERRTKRMHECAREECPESESSPAPGVWRRSRFSGFSGGFFSSVSKRGREARETAAARLALCLLREKIVC